MSKIWNYRMMIENLFFLWNNCLWEYNEKKKPLGVKAANSYYFKIIYFKKGVVIDV